MIKINARGVRQARKVPADWRHPQVEDSSGKLVFEALFPGSKYAATLEQWQADSAAWARGEFPEYASAGARKLTFEQWDGPAPDPSRYMPQWPADVATHYMMYETSTEGTPVSPAFATPEGLARYCAEAGVKVWADQTMDYKQWLALARDAV